MIYPYLGHFMTEKIPNLLGIQEWKKEYLFVLMTLFEHQNLFLWIISITTYLGLFFTENTYFKNLSETNKKLKLMEEENKKLKKVIENLVQRQENYEEMTTNVHVKEIEELKIGLRDEMHKLNDIIVQFMEERHSKEELIDKNMQSLKNTLSIQKSRITKLKNQMDEKICELNEQYETLSMNDTASLVDDDDV